MSTDALQQYGQPLADNLVLWTATRKQDVDQILFNQSIPQNISGGNHVALRRDTPSAADRATWYNDTEKHDLVLIKITFTWKAIGYFMVAKPLLWPLETDMIRWRFYGDIPFEVRCPTTNEVMISVDTQFQDCVHQS